MRFNQKLLLLCVISVIFSCAEFKINIPSFNLPKNQIIKTKRISERGIYVTSSTAQSKAGMAYIKNILKTRGLNTVVLDANYLIDPDLIPIAKARKLKEAKLSPSIKLKAIIDELHKDNIIVSARIVAFKDDRLVSARPDLGIRLPGGKIYQDRKGGLWVNPYSEEGRLYKELMAEVAAMSGADEIQFDYTRFPAEGLAKTVVYPQETKGISRVDVICLFLKETKERLDKYNVSLAVDIFGVTAWQSKTDIKNLGQDIKRMAKYLDVLSPMLYPSHFHNGYDGIPNPGSQPYYFMNTGVKKSLEILSGEATLLVPWIQGFNMRSPNYGPGYIAAQAKACRDAKVPRFLIWNARNFYDTVPANL